MKRQPFVSLVLGGVNLTEFGLKIPSAFSKLSVSNSEIDSYTSWELLVTVGGDSSKDVNVSAFEALLYSSAQDASRYENSSGIPVSFIFGWLDWKGEVEESVSYQGWTINFDVSASDVFLTYKITGYAQLGMSMHIPVINVPELCGFVQPSAVVEAIAIATKADRYYDLDIDHCDAPTLVNHGAMTTSFTNYVRGSYSGEDDYGSFPGLLKLSTSYNASRDAAGLKGLRKLSQGINNLTVTGISDYLKPSLTDYTPQCSTFSFWIEEPTMTKLGTIHYKSNAGLSTLYNSDTLEYGTAHTNVLSISGSYSGVSYNISDLNFSYLGFTVDGSGNSIANPNTVVNSWSSSLGLTFQTADIINDVNALATQFSGSMDVTIPGSVKGYSLAQPVSLIVMSGNTISPLSGIYNIMGVSHEVSNSFTTTLKLQRLVMSSANQVATSQGIIMPTSSSGFRYNSYTKTSNVISESKVDFGEVYPTFEDIGTVVY